MDLPFEIVGSLPDTALKDNLAAFSARLKDDPWGGEGLARLVVSPIDDGLKEWLPSSEYARWKAGYEQGRATSTGAKAFVASDGLRTAVVPPVPDKNVFLLFACHEMVESSLDRRHTAEGHEFKEGTHTSLAHVLWTEYVVERTRRTIANDLGWGYSKIDNGFIVEQMSELEAETTALVQRAVENNALPHRTFQLWFEMARVYAMALGRAHTGCPADEDQIQRFRQMPLAVQTGDGWDALDQSLGDAFDRPEDDAATLDDSVRNAGWIILYGVGVSEAAQLFARVRSPHPDQRSGCDGIGTEKDRNPLAVGLR